MVYNQGGSAMRVFTGIGDPERRAKNDGGASRLVPPDRLDLVELLALPPGPGGLTALAEGQAHDGDGRSACGRKGHGAASSPDKISGMSTDHQDGPVLPVTCVRGRGHVRRPATTNPRLPVPSRRSARASPTAAPG